MAQIFLEKLKKRTNNMIKKGKCTVCKKVFTVKKGESLIGKLGIIPVDLCKTHLKKVLSYDEMNLNDTRV